LDDGTLLSLTKLSLSIELVVEVELTLISVFLKVCESVLLLLLKLEQFGSQLVSLEASVVETGGEIFNLLVRLVKISFGLLALSTFRTQILSGVGKLLLEFNDGLVKVLNGVGVLVDLFDLVITLALRSLAGGSLRN